MAGCIQFYRRNIRVSETCQESKSKWYTFSNTVLQQAHGGHYKKIADESNNIPIYLYDIPEDQLWKYLEI